MSVFNLYDKVKHKKRNNIGIVITNYTEIGWIWDTFNFNTDIADPDIEIEKLDVIVEDKVIYGTPSINWKTVSREGI